MTELARTSALYVDGKTVFVTGASGLAGSAVVRALLAISSTVKIRATFRQTASHFVSDPRVAYIQADLRDRSACVAAASGCDAAILAAAVAGGAQQNATAPWLQVTDNLVIDAITLQAVHDAGIRRTIYVSSGTVYPEHDGPVREDDLDWNRDPPEAYLGVGWAKRSAEKTCGFWHKKTGMTVIVVRAANIFGPLAKFDPATSNFVPALVRKAVERMDPFEVWGAPDFGRDILFADDFGEAIVALLNATQISYDTFNIGSNRTTTIGDVVRCALNSANHKPREIAWVGNPGSSPPTRVLDCGKIKGVIGWEAHIGIEEGIRRTVSWWQQNRTTWSK